MEQLGQNDFLHQLFNKSSNHDFVSIMSDRYTNKLFEISFEIPKKWHVVSLEKFNDAANKQILNDSFEEFKALVLELIESPSCVLTKYDPNSNEKDGIVSPTINFSIIHKVDNYKNMSLSDYADLLEKSGPEVIKEFKITNKGDIFKQDSYSYIKFDSEYLFEHPELNGGIMVELSVLNIDYHDFFLDFSLTQCKAQGEIAENEFERFINSIELKKINSL